MAGGAGERNGEPVRVLVVEDDPELREMLLYALRNRGYQVQEAGDGLQALHRLQHGSFDVVVTDFQMPRLDGLALLREVRAMPSPPPVVILTGLVEPPMERQLYRAGAFRVLRKGGHLADLMRSIEEAGALPASPPARYA